MPFDECKHEGGGGGRDPHDFDMLLEIAKASLVAMRLNCDRTGACEFHAGLMMLGLMGGAMSDTLRDSEGAADVDRMVDSMIGYLHAVTEELEEEKAKWHTTQ